jgi:hypothetical protein
LKLNLSSNVIIEIGEKGLITKSSMHQDKSYILIFHSDTTCFITVHCSRAMIARYMWNEVPWLW